MVTHSSNQNIINSNIIQNQIILYSFFLLLLSAAIQSLGFEIDGDCLDSFGNQFLVPSYLFDYDNYVLLSCSQENKISTEKVIKIHILISEYNLQFVFFSHFFIEITSHTIYQRTYVCVYALVCSSMTNLGAYEFVYLTRISF